MPYTIRPMEPGDVPRVAAIDRLSFPRPWPPAAFLHELRHDRSRYYVLLRPGADANGTSEQWGHWLRRALGLLEDSRVVGYVGFRFQNGEAHITTIAVHPDWRGKGLGELLLLTALEEVVRHRADVVTLEMRPSNEIAHRLYEKYGFQLTGVNPRYYQDGEDAWLMEVQVNREAYRARLAKLRQALETNLSRRQIIGVDDQTP